MMKNKEMSSKSVTFATGGPARGSTQMKTGTQIPGQTGQMGRNGKIAQGGSAKMAPQGSARPAKSGVTSSN